MKGAAAASFLLRVGEMAEKKKAKVNVRVLNRRALERMQRGEIKVIVKGGLTLTYSIHSPLLNDKKLVVYEGNTLIMVSSRRKLAIDIENYLKKQGLEPLYIYPATQLSLV
jgi:hypothetical protein